MHFIKLNRTDEAINLQHNMCANHLLNVIALRISTSDNPVVGLKRYEAKIGDYNNYGMTRQQYRTALKKLEQWGYINIVSSHRYTIVKLNNNSVYKIL